ncbi:unnamed protein product [Pelagomonas calceolata]|uniref:BUB1 N-terminal domain-containing protein n=1 Tax=Pelagomonas calceolata TaxID=35677 RepID=A0A7S4E6Z8_9STRA|nr:unnamed protein product [Pelagomonas calceolata]|mmetsp:Transcript_6012/g.17950  ORF Transcript_6012/g.17950 Transcript_6012/m.17950 type:complete len:391 (-) Transcript_6012:37-1209(-)
MAGDPLAARLAEIAVAPDAERHRLRQRCVETFAADARYRGDERFARVWLALAAASPDPGAVFDAMARHRVGESLALVWVARAFVAEKAKKFAEADALFARGLEMKAAPQDLLVKRRREFERRMRRHWLNQQQAPPEPPTPPRVVDEDATATATQVLALHKATAQPFAIFDEAPAPASSFAIFDDDAGGVADEQAAAAGGDRAVAAPAALAARFDAEARPTPVIFEDAPAAPKPTPGGFRIFEDNSDAPPKPTPALRGPRVAIFEDAAAAPAEAAPRGRVAFAVEEEISFEERRARVGPQDRIAAIQAPKTARRAFGELQAVDESMVMTNMKPKRLLFSTASKRAPQTLRRAEKEDLTINSAIALREMDSLFGSPASKPPETCRRAIFRDE